MAEARRKTEVWSGEAAPLALFFRIMASADWISRFQHRWGELTRRAPLLVWLERWGISVASVLLGLLTLFIFHRPIGYFPWFIGYLILLWMAGVLFLETRQELAARSPRVIGRVMDYTVQTMLHGVFLFLLPIYYASTTLLSNNVTMLLLLAAAAVLTSIDPWYQAVFRQVRWIELFLFWLGLFASLNVAFPLVGIRAAPALLLSAVLSVLVLAPTVRRRLGTGWREATTLTVLAAGVAGLVLWSARSWIPPVPLNLSRATFAKSVVRLEPVESVEEVSVAEVSGWGGLSAFTAVTAPVGLQEEILHVWKRNGVPVGTIRLSPIRGLPQAAFRTYSRKRDLGKNPEGTWEVDVVTPFDQLIGRVKVRVTP